MRRPNFSPEYERRFESPPRPEPRYERRLEILEVPRQTKFDHDFFCRRLTPESESN